MKNKRSQLSLFALITICFVANSQIFYQDINPDIVIDTWDAHDVHIDSSTTAVLSYGGPGNLSIWQEFNTRIAINAFSDCEVMMDAGYPSALDLDEPIDSSANWLEPDYAILNNGTLGNWIGVTDKYLGVRVFNGMQWLYGWIRLDVNTAGNSVTIKDYACMRTPYAPIKAGQTTTTIIDDLSQTEVNSVTVYPNPFSSFTTISSNQEFREASMNIFNLQSQKVRAITKITGTEFKSEKGDLKSGVYFLHITNENSISVLKIFITE